MAGARRIPPLSLLLGYGPMALFPLLGLATWFAPPWPAFLAAQASQAWAGVMLVFLAGVRRGLSFFTDGGPRPAQIATMLWLFLAGCATLTLPLPWALVLAIVGLGSVAVLDPRAARRGEAPAFFAQLRPPQMAVAVIGLLAIGWRVWS